MSGSDAGIRNIGRFFLALIPWALAIGFMAWGGVWIALHQYRAEVAQMQRSSIYVGGRLTSKMKIEPLPSGCITIVRADYDGSDLDVFARNDCDSRISYADWNWQEVSSDGVVLHQDDSNLCAVPSMPKSKAECMFTYGDAFSLPTDDRTALIRVWVTGD